MKFTATKEQVLQIAANAVNAAKPVGMGVLHYQPVDYDAAEMGPYVTQGYDGKTALGIDYYHGRMTKLFIRQISETEWETPDHGPTIDYQSWMVKYPTYEALVGSVIQ